MDERKKEILEQYEKDLVRWRERGGHYKDIQPMTTQEALYLRQMLHPTKRAATKQVTEDLVNLLCEHRIMTAQEIYQLTGLSDKPVLRRLKTFTQFGLIRRESKKYYLATPRLEEVRKKHLARICAK